MSTTIHNGHRPVTILNAAERVTGRRGSWTVRSDIGGGPIVGIASKRVALSMAAAIARAERTAARRMAAAHVRLAAMAPADQAVILTAANDQGQPISRIFDQLDEALAGPSAASANIRTLARKLHADRVEATVAAARVTLAEIEAHAAEQAPADDAETRGTDDADHRPLPRPATSRAIGDDARDGLEATCWDCGARIVQPTGAAAWWHVAVQVGDVVQAPCCGVPLPEGCACGTVGRSTAERPTLDVATADTIAARGYHR